MRGGSCLYSVRDARTGGYNSLAHECRARRLTHLCLGRHLIADHLGWFKESTQEGKLKTVEDLLRAKGEKVRRGRIDAGGVVEYTPE